MTKQVPFVLGCPYRWAFLHDALAGEVRRVRVDGCVYDLASSRD